MNQESTLVLAEAVLLLIALGMAVWWIVPLVNDLIKLARWLKARRTRRRSQGQQQPQPPPPNRQQRRGMGGYER